MLRFSWEFTHVMTMEKINPFWCFDQPAGCAGAVEGSTSVKYSAHLQANTVFNTLTHRLVGRPRTRFVLLSPKRTLLTIALCANGLMPLYCSCQRGHDDEDPIAGATIELIRFSIMLLSPHRPLIC